VFGLGFGEMVVLAVVLLVVVGPRELPKLLKSLGRGINKLRRMSSDLRKQSGIDDIINEEGLREDLDAIRSLSRGRLIEGALDAAAKPAPRRSQPRRKPRSTKVSLDELAPPDAGEPPDPEQEWPAVGCDAYGALPDDADPSLPAEPNEDEAPDSDPYADADADFDALEKEDTA
jgi:sec-independent protein translocase protein TatB